MEIAMPARLMMFEVMAMKYMGMNASATEIGIVMIGTIAEGICQRKKSTTKLTMIISIIRSSVRLWMDFLINSERSYVETTSTPSGSDGLISSSLVFTRPMTLSA